MILKSIESALADGSYREAGRAVKMKNIESGGSKTPTRTFGLFEIRSRFGSRPI
jgi:hypothetical protein